VVRKLLNALWHCPVYLILSKERIITFTPQQQKDIQQLCYTIEEDNLFTADQRIKLKQMSNMENEKVVGELISRIANYLSTGTAEIHGEKKVWRLDPTDQRFRRGLLATLKDIANKESLADAEKKSEACKGLQDIVRNMQLGYSDVVTSYGELKKILSV
jgi:hypothetical protein